MCKRQSPPITMFLLFAILTLISACGSSNSSSTPTAAISGSVFASSVAGASLSVQDGSGVPQAGAVTTGSDGTFNVTVPQAVLSSNLRFQATGGTFTDEVTGSTVTAGTLSAYVSGGSMTAGTSINLTPASTIVHDLIVQHSKTVDVANNLFTNAFGFAPDTNIMPKNAASDGNDTPERLAGFRAGIFSQLSQNLGLAPEQQFDLLPALAEDLSDGSLDGMDGAAVVSLGSGSVLAEDVQNRYENAMVSFLSNTACNQTGLTADQIGSLPFSKVALTNMYRIEYLPGMMPAAQGKTTFGLKVTNRSNGSAAPGLTLSLMPKMHMATMGHATPVDSITDNGDGTYTCTIYYLMSSVMNGMSMGFWEVKVSTGGMGAESATFYPAVGMAMGSDTVRATLKGQNDTIMSMTGPEKRSYYLFKDGLVSGATTTFNLFIAAKESMMSYPAVSAGTVLSSPVGTVTTMTVEASTDLANWVSATDNSHGHWSVGGISGLLSGQTGTIYVKVNVNGEDKTTDGNAPSGSNAYASFTVIP